VVQTSPYSGQKPGTSGLRKPVSTVVQQGYVENFVQCTLNNIKASLSLDQVSAPLLVGGDGRYYNSTVIPLVARMAAANGFSRVVVGKDGLFSTPACSGLITVLEGWY